MKYILIEDVKSLGKKGDLVNAKQGYARNFLIPNKLAIEATKENLEKWEADNKQKREEERLRRQEAETLKKKLESITIKVKAKTGASDKLFGSITAIDIAQALENQEGIVIDKKKIELADNIKNLGRYRVDIRIYPEVVAQCSVEVIKFE